MVENAPSSRQSAAQLLSTHRQPTCVQRKKMPLLSWLHNTRCLHMCHIQLFPLPCKQPPAAHNASPWTMFHQTLNPTTPAVMPCYAPPPRPHPLPDAPRLPRQLMSLTMRCSDRSPVSPIAYHQHPTTLRCRFLTKAVFALTVASFCTNLQATSPT